MTNKIALFGTIFLLIMLYFGACFGHQLILKESKIAQDYPHFQEADSIYGKANRKTVEWEMVASYGKERINAYKYNYRANDTLVINLPEDFKNLKVGDQLIINSIEDHGIKFITLTSKKQ